MGDGQIPPEEVSVFTKSVMAVSAFLVMLELPATMIYASVEILLARTVYLIAVRISL